MDWQLLGREGIEVWRGKGDRGEDGMRRAAGKLHRRREERWRKRYE